VADLRSQKQLPPVPPGESNNFVDNQKNSLKTRKIIVFCLLSAILLVIWQTGRFKDSSDTNQSKSQTLLGGEQNKKQNKADSEIESRFSMGEKILIGADNNPAKQSAAEMFAAGRFQEAYFGFTNSLKANPNDPEALIYLNNSVASIYPDPVKIAVSVPIGGSLDVAKEILRGVAQAQNEINTQGGLGQGGIKHKYFLQVLIANDDNEPETAEQVATKFVNDAEIMGVVGHNSSDASIAAAPIYEEGKLVMISPTSVARELSQAGSYIFRTTPSARTLAETLAKYVVNDARRDRIAICDDSSSPASVSFKEEFSLAVFELGGEISDTACDFGSKNFSSDRIPSRAIADGAEALLLIPDVDRINQALEVAKANQRRLTLLGNHSMYTYETLKIGGSDVNGMVLPVAWHPESEANSEFNVETQKIWGDNSGSWRTATAYDATKALIGGLNFATTRQQLQQTIAHPGFDTPGVLGKIVFQPSGDRQIKGTLVKVQPGKSSGTGFDFN
jgi:branched-chain amino acid transport system substrate-binding protein